MSTATFFVLAAIAVVVILGLKAWRFGTQSAADMREAKLKLQRERETRCRFRGWDYATPEDAAIKFRVHGRTESGVSWDVLYDSNHQSSSPTPRLVFTAKKLASADLADHWHLSDRKTWDMVQKQVPKAIIGGVVSLVTMVNPSYARKAAFYKAAKSCDAGSHAFRERFVLASTNSRWARVVNGEVEKRILSAPPFKPSMSRPDNCISAGVNEDGFEAKLYVDGPDADTLENFIDLGVGLCERVLHVKRGAL